MEALEKAIERITYMSKKFPKAELELISANREAAVPYLRQSIETAISQRESLEENYQLHFYALFLLAEFQDRESFPRIMELAALPRDVLEDLIGDMITSGLNDILYHTYNGDLELLKNAVMDSKIDEFARGAMLEVMGQLYCDGELPQEEWKEFIRLNAHKEDAAEEEGFIYNKLCEMICRCHFFDMCPELRFMSEHQEMDEYDTGRFDVWIDWMFRYSEDEKRFCAPSVSTVDTLRNWAMFESETPPVKGKKENSLKELERLYKAAKGTQGKQAAKIKIGRNDPCPCGSGKKYKQCCLNKPASLDPIDRIEDEQKRKEALRYYPETGRERQEGRIYLEDYFDPESIEIDKLLYLGLMERPGFLWLRDGKAERDRTIAYLKMAFERFRERVARERIQTFEEYDKQYSIHYHCETWLYVLTELLRENGEETLCKEVEKCRKKMSKVKRAGG